MPMDTDDALTTTSSSSNRGRNKAKSTAHLAPSDLPAGQRIATWPLVPCAGKDCATVARWRDCFEDHLTIRTARGFYADDEPRDDSGLTFPGAATRFKE